MAAKKMPKHTFEGRCLDFAAILSKPSLAHMLSAVKKQAHTHEAHQRTDPTYKANEDYPDSPPEFCPAYYGGFTEWFAEKFLNYYGHKFNIAGVEMVDVVGSAEDDLGTDGRGVTMKDTKHHAISSITPVAGAKVHIQVKGSLNPTKEHKANDGSRLPNFIMNATTNSIVNGRAYRERYLLFTTAAGIHYKLKQMSNDILEVVNFQRIKKTMDGDIAFLNSMRKAVKLKTLPFADVPMDAEAEWNINNC